MSEPNGLEADTAVDTPPASGRSKPPWVRIVFGVIGAAIAVALPHQFNAIDVDIFSSVLYLAIAAMGLNLLTGYNGQISIGHGAFFGVGAFTSAILVSDYGWSIEATIPIAAVLAAALGVAVGFPALRVKGLYLALITLGLAVLFPVVTKKYVKGPGGASLKILNRQEVSSRYPELLADDQYRYYLCLIILVVLFWFAHNLINSRVGRSMIAVRDQEVAASTVGIDVARVKVATFALSAAYAGVAGSLSVMVTKIADASNPLVYFQLSIEFLIAVVIGGSATIAGPLLGSMALVWIRRRTDSADDFLPKLLGLEDRSEQLAPAMLGGILIVLTFVLPDGIVGGFHRLVNRIRTLRAGSGDGQPPVPATTDANSPTAP